MFWPADLHMVGKDILRFHAVYWPAFLMAAELAPPRRVFAHGWWTIEGQKMSKSLGNVINPHHLVETYGLDQTRYFLLREVPFGSDGDFSHRAMVNRINSDLANNWGNLVQRVLSLVQKNCDGRAPALERLSDRDEILLSAAGSLLETVRAQLEKQSFSDALAAIWGVIDQANRYIDTEAPWTLRKTDPTRMATVLAVLVETIRHVAIMTQPLMPASADKVLDLLMIPSDARGFDRLSRAHALVGGVKLPPPTGVFPRHIDNAGAGGEAGQGAPR
jgi:methionyl-tRNA synthetase